MNGTPGYTLHEVLHEARALLDDARHDPRRRAVSARSWAARRTALTRRIDALLSAGAATDTDLLAAARDARDLLGSAVSVFADTVHARTWGLRRRDFADAVSAFDERQSGRGGPNPAAP